MIHTLLKTPILQRLIPQSSCIFLTPADLEKPSGATQGARCSADEGTRTGGAAEASEYKQLTRQDNGLRRLESR
jgi:hypothetical protein